MIKTFVPTTPPPKDKEKDYVYKTFNYGIEIPYPEKEGITIILPKLPNNTSADDLNLLNTAAVNGIKSYHNKTRKVGFGYIAKSYNTQFVRKETIGIQTPFPLQCLKQNSKISCNAKSRLVFL
jgi:hypothetical protein